MTTQQDCSIGLSVAEGTYGVPVVATKFPEFVSEGLDWMPTFVQGKGLRAGSRVPRAARRTLGRQMAGGPIVVEAGSKGLGAFLAAALGTVVTTQRTTTGVYQQNHTPTTTDFLPSYTLQKGIPLLGGGAVQPFQYPGSLCDSITFDCPNSDIVLVTTNWNCNSLNTSAAYAAPSYPTPVELFTFVEGSVYVGASAITGPTTTALGTTAGSALDVTEFHVTVENNLDDGGFNMGGGGTRSRKPATGLQAITGTLTAEFDSTTLRDAYLGQLDLGVLLTFAGLSTIGTGSANPGLQIWIPDIRLEGDVPNSNAGAPILQTIPFTGLNNLTNPPITISYVSTDITP